MISDGFEALFFAQVTDGGESFVQAGGAVEVGTDGVLIGAGGVGGDPIDTESGVRNEVRFTAEDCTEDGKLMVALFPSGNTMAGTVDPVGEKRFQECLGAGATEGAVGFAGEAVPSGLKASDEVQVAHTWIYT